MGFTALGRLGTPTKLLRLDIDVDPTLAPYPGKEAKKVASTNADGDSSEFWTCPICFSDLGTGREEIGALTHQGKRVEKVLYHLGCVSMMLIHGVRAGQGNVAGPKHRPKINGQSPVTRKAVDGFLPMPPFSEGKKWAQFMDWRGSGKVVTGEVIEVGASLLPTLQKGAVERSVCQILNIDNVDLDEHEILLDELEAKVLPFLEGKAAAVAKAQAVQEPALLIPVSQGSEWDNVANKGKKNTFAEALAYVSAVSGDARFYSRELGPPMWTACRLWHKAARRLLVREACIALEKGSGDLVRLMKAVSCMVKPTDVRARKVTQVLLKDSRWDVRKESLALLVIAAPRGDAQALNAIFRHFKDPAPQVQEAAIFAMGRAAELGNEQAIRSVASQLSDKDGSIRKAAEETLGMMAALDDPNAVNSIKVHLNDPDIQVRKAALRSLPTVCQRGHRDGIAAIKKLLSDKDPSVRIAAVQSFAQLAEPSDRKSLQTIRPKLKDADPEVREAALQSLPVVAEPGSQDLMTALLTCFKDSQVQVRITALQLAPEATPQGHPQVVRAVVGLLKDGESRVRAVAASVLANYANVREPIAVQALSDLLYKGQKEADPHVRRTAEAALHILDPAQGEDSAEAGETATTPSSPRRTSWLSSLSRLRRSA